MNLERSISNLSKRIERFDSSHYGSSNELRYWKGRRIIPLNEWVVLKKTSSYDAQQYFPDDFDNFWTFLTEDKLKDVDEHTRKWHSDYLELMEYVRNPNYGETKCSGCLLSPHWEEAAIFIVINKPVARSLQEVSNNKNDDNNNLKPIYPCQIVNRFECPYKKGKTANTKFDVDDLFELEKMVFAVEIAFAETMKHTSKLHIKNKQELYHALTDRETFSRILEYGLEDEEIRKHKDKIVDHFMDIKDKVKLEELNFYPCLCDQGLDVYNSYHKQFHDTRA